jgi:hypothetical protein
MNACDCGYHIRKPNSRMPRGKWPARELNLRDKPTVPSSGLFPYSDSVNYHNGC